MAKRFQTGKVGGGGGRETDIPSFFWGNPYTIYQYQIKEKHTKEWEKIFFKTYTIYEYQIKEKYTKE